ncbi:MAG TPA: hypothetical protein PKC28_06620 [Bdellovibrionales bacterium]|nr:hypothetical protein [Bdellovibrionales bacterium]
MPTSGIPEDIKQFIFAHIDSVEQLEVLMLLRQDLTKSYTPTEVANEMRTSPASATLRLNTLTNQGFVEMNDGSYRFAAGATGSGELLDRLTEIYRVRRHKVLELIFSPMKRARNFADAFVVSKSNKSEDSDA